MFEFTKDTCVAAVYWQYEVAVYLLVGSPQWAWTSTQRLGLPMRVEQPHALGKKFAR